MSIETIMFALETGNFTRKVYLYVMFVHIGHYVYKIVCCKSFTLPNEFRPHGPIFLTVILPLTSDELLAIEEMKITDYFSYTKFNVISSGAVIRHRLAQSTWYGVL